MKALELLIAVCLNSIFLLAPGYGAQNFVEGDTREVIVNIGGSPKNLQMVYVPAATATSPQNDGDDTAGAKLQLPFFFSLTELTLEEFELFAPDYAHASHEERQQRMAATEELQADLMKMKADSNQYYATMVSLDEAAAVTAALTESLSQADRSDELIQSRFRIPTANEWQRAASMNSKEHTFINPWPDFDNFSEREKGRCQELWKACRGVGPFTCSENQMSWLISEATTNSGKRLELATIVFRFLLNGRLLNPEKENSHSWEIQPEPLAETIDAAPANEWGISGIHRGYPEWVLHVASSTEATRYWRLIEDEVLSTDKQKKQLFGLSGASSLTLNKNDLTPLQQLFVSYQHVFGGQTTISWTDVEDADICVDRSVTVRLVLVDCLADDWLTSVRKTAMDSENMNSLREEVNDYKTDVSSLTSGSERDRYLSLIEAWAAIAQYQTGDRAQAGATIKTSKAFGSQATKTKLNTADILAMMNQGASPQANKPSKKIPPDSLYFQATGELMEKDSISL